MSLWSTSVCQAVAAVHSVVRGHYICILYTMQCSDSTKSKILSSLVLMTQFVLEDWKTMFGLEQSKYWGNISLNIWPGKWRWTPGRKTVNISLSTTTRQAGGSPSLISILTFGQPDFCSNCFHPPHSVHFYFTQTQTVKKKNTILMTWSPCFLLLHKYVSCIFRGHRQMCCVRILAPPEC